MLWCLFCCLTVALRDPSNETVLIEGVLFRARYLGSTQLISEGQPSKTMRMMQAQEAVGRIKVTIHFNINISTFILFKAQHLLTASHQQGLLQVTGFDWNFH